MAEISNPSMGDCIEIGLTYQGCCQLNASDGANLPNMFLD